MVTSPAESDTSYDGQLDEVEWEMLCSDREVAGGFVPDTNVDLIIAMRAVGGVEPRERLTPSRMKKLTQCPECEGQNLIPVIAGRRMNFFCRDCTLCWHLTGDQVARVNPWTCPGCALATTACFEHFDLRQKPPLRS